MAHRAQSVSVVLSAVCSFSTVAVALWALQETAVAPTLELVVDGVVDGGVGPIAVNNPGWEQR